MQTPLCHEDIRNDKPGARHDGDGGRDGHGDVDEVHFVVGMHLGDPRPTGGDRRAAPNRQAGSDARAPYAP